MPRPQEKKKLSSDDSDSGPDDRTPAKKSKSEVAPKSLSSAKPGGNNSSSGSGESTWILEKLRMVKINEFRGKKMVDIREFYDAGGEIRPGKKGISLSITQWKKLCEHMDEITKAIDQ